MAGSRGEDRAETGASAAASGERRGATAAAAKSPQKVRGRGVGDRAPPPPPPPPHCKKSNNKITRGRRQVPTYPRGRRLNGERLRCESTGAPRVTGGRGQGGEGRGGGGRRTGARGWRGWPAAFRGRGHLRRPFEQRSPPTALASRDARQLTFSLCDVSVFFGPFFLPFSLPCVAF